MKYSIMHNFARFQITQLYLLRKSSLTGGGSCIPPLSSSCCGSCPAMANVVFTASTILPLSSLPQKVLVLGGILRCLLKLVIILILYMKMPFQVNLIYKLK